MESESQESLESTDKFQPVVREALEERPTPPRRPIPSVVRRDDAAPVAAPTKPSAPAAQSFGWPLAASKPQSPAPWKPPAAPPKATPPARPSPMARPMTIPPITAKPAPAAAMNPLPRVPRSTVSPPPAAAPVAIEPAPVVVAPAPAPAPVPVVVAPAPVVVAPAPAPVVAAPETAPAAFGSSMLQSHNRKAKMKKVVASDAPAVDLAALGPTPTFGAGMLTARKSGGKLLVIAVVLAIAAIGGLVVVRGGASAKPAPAPTAQP
jgi:hypothetical protein